MCYRTDNSKTQHKSEWKDSRRRRGTLAGTLRTGFPFLIPLGMAPCHVEALASEHTAGDSHTGDPTQVHLVTHRRRRVPPKEENFQTEIHPKPHGSESLSHKILLCNAMSHREFSHLD